MEGNIIYLLVCNDFSKNILESRYMDLLKTAIAHVTDNPYNVQLVIEEDIKSDSVTTHNHQHRS